MVKRSSRSLDRTFGALADPTRRRILAALARGDRTVGEIARPFRISLPAVSRHIRVLRRAGLLTQMRRGRDRQCRLVAQPFHDVSQWIEQYRRFWSGQLDSLEQFLTQNSEADSR